MSVAAPVPPDDHYIWLGRVMHACSMLELQIGLIGWASVNGHHYTEQWTEVAGTPGGAWRVCESRLPEMSDALAADVGGLLSEAKQVRDERNKFAHAVFILDPDRPAGEQWILRSARDREFGPLTQERGAILVATANRLSRRAGDLRSRAAAESKNSTSAMRLA